MDVSLFNSLKKDRVRYVRMRDMKKCTSRSMCVISSGILRVKGISHNVFLKVSPCLYDYEIAQSESRARKTPQFVETRMMKITNKLNTKNVCRSIVYCYNRLALTKSLGIIGGGFHSILLTEDVQSYMRFDDFVRRARPEDIASVLFQLVYTLQCMNTIRLTHTDLHFGNMFVKRRNMPGYYDTYEFRYNKGFHKVRIPCTYQLKIIDFDGAHKGPITGFRQLQIYDPTFTKTVRNPLLPWGDTKVLNARFDVLKVVFHLHNARDSLKALLRRLGFKNKYGKVPFYDFNPSHSFPNRNIVGANDYGMFYNKKGNFLTLNDSHIYRPKDIIVDCAVFMHGVDRGMKLKEFDVLSQRGLGLRF